RCSFPRYLEVNEQRAAPGKGPPMDTCATADRKGPAKLIALLRLSVVAAIAVVGLAACTPAATPAAFRTAGYGTAAGATSASSSMPMPMPMPAGQMASAGP